MPYLPLKVNFEGLRSGWRRAVEKAKMEQFNFHDLRHSCATILLELEVPLERLGGQVDLHQTSTPAKQRQPDATMKKARKTLILRAFLSGGWYRD